MGEGLDFDTGFDPVDPETWREHVEAGLRDGARFELLRTQLEGALTVEPLYHPGDLPAAPTGRPGAPPFVRGSNPEAGWRLVGSLADRADPSELSAAARRARSLEVDALHLGPAVCARLGRAGVEAIGGPIVLDPGAEALAWLGVASETVELRFDPLATLARSGRLPYDAAQASRWLAELATEGRRVLVDATPHHDAGATPAEELGFALAAGVAHLRALGDAGHPLADAPRRMVFALAVDADDFLSIAKLRAARLCWSKVLRATGIDGAGHGMHIHAFESRRAQTTLDPVVGALRGVSAALGAIVGGADEVTLHPYASTPAGERLAIQTQHILRSESHLARVRDPAGGAYYVEAFTDRLAREAWSVLGELEAEGGAWAGLVEGRLARRYARAADLRRAELSARRRGRVGINRYPGAEDPEALVEVVPVEPRVGSERAPKTVREAFRAAPRGALAKVIAESGVEVEILTNELRRVGTELIAEALAPLREAAPFEALRQRAATLPEPRRSALVLGVGERRVVAPRMDFAREALLVAGLRVELRGPTPTAPSLEGAPPTVIVCSTEPLAPLVARARAAGAEVVFVAGPDEPDSSVDGRLHRDMDAVAVLAAVLGALERSS